MSFNPASAIATVIDTAIGTLTINTNLFTTEQREPGFEIPQLAVFCLQNGGDTPESYCNGSDPTGVRLYKPAVLIRVRCAPHAFATGQALARSIRAAIHELPPSGYIACIVRESEPVFIGEEDNGSFTWQLNADLMIED